MSEQPVIYNEQEQKQLQQLDAQVQGFANFKNATLRSLHSGQDAKIVADLVQFLHEIGSQAVKQAETIKAAAEARANAPKAE